MATQDATATLDPETTAEALGVTAAEIRGVLENSPAEVSITEIHAYQHATALCTLAEPLDFSDGQPAEFALVTFSGRVFPCDRAEPDHIRNLFALAGIETLAQD